MAADESDPRLVAEFEALIAVSKRDDFRNVENAILDRLKTPSTPVGVGLSAVAAYRLLRKARADLLGQVGPGLSRVTRDGNLEPLGPGMPATPPSVP